LHFSHLNSAGIIAQRQKEQTIRELYELTELFSTDVVRVAVLKGAAYIVLKLPNHHGRTFSDIDLLTDRDSLPHLEQGFLLHGWSRGQVDDYDDQYYRQWMHEIPPLYHRQRKTVIDLHHNILPLTSRNAVDATMFNYQTVIIDRVGELKTLENKDLLIHTAVHLFTESEFHQGLRDISDLHMLMQFFEDRQPGFLNETLIRAQSLGLETFLLLAYRYVYMIFGYTLPEDLQALISHNQSVRQKVLDFSFIAVLKPFHASCRDWQMALGKFVLYWRGHFMRMPLRLLIPHLLHKTFITPIDKYRAEKRSAEIQKN